MVSARFNYAHITQLLDIVNSFASKQVVLTIRTENLQNITDLQLVSEHLNPRKDKFSLEMCAQQGTLRVLTYSHLTPESTKKLVVIAKKITIS